MSNNRSLLSAANHIKEQFVLSSIERYCSETGISKADFIAIEPTDFDGEIYAIDGSNVVVCNWAVTNLNRIRAGYVIYRGRTWQRTVITYDDIFWARVIKLDFPYMFGDAQPPLKERLPAMLRCLGFIEVDGRWVLLLPQNPLGSKETDNIRPKDKVAPPAQAQIEHASAEKVLDSDLMIMKRKKNPHNSVSTSGLKAELQQADERKREWEEHFKTPSKQGAELDANQFGCRGQE